jgi:hypothetical protein
MSRVACKDDEIKKDQVILCCPNGPLINLLQLTVANILMPVCVGSTGLVT